MKRFICTIFAIIFIISICLIPTYAYTEYTGATINVIHCGYNRDWEVDPGMPLLVVEIESSGNEIHYLWIGIKRAGQYAWEEHWIGPYYTNSYYHSELAYGYPDGLQTDYGAFLP